MHFGLCGRGRCRRRRIHPLAPVALLAAALLLIPQPAAALSTGCLPSLEYAAADEHFFAQTGSDTGLGFFVRDDADARFLSAFRAGGGEHALGYPVSRRFLQDGFIYQAFQKAILQWPIGGDRANYANTVDWLGRIGADTDLYAQRQVPFYFPLAADRGLDPADPEDFAHIVQNHLQLLAVDEVIREFFLKEPRWLELYGLPVSYEDFGPVRVLRSQRQIIQVWNVPGIGGPVGQAVLANTGDIAKEFGLLPESATDPISPPVRPGDALHAAALPARAGSPTLVEVSGTAAQVRAAGNPTVSFCIGDSQHLLVPIPVDQEPGATTLDLETIGAGPVLAESVRVEIEELEYETYELVGVAGDLELLFDPEVEAADKAALQESVAPVTLRPLFSEPFQAPVPGRVTAGFGDRRTVALREEMLLHLGIDYAGDLDDPILAPAPGTVAGTLDLVIYGRTVVIDHGLGVFSVLAHLEDFSVEPGDRVAAGDEIGTVGSTGRSTGPHLHWEVHVFGIPVDPNSFLDPDSLKFGVPLADRDAELEDEPADPQPPATVG
ncbi:MAG: M23 family metallopeptidase [Chloroflexota bacterium]|nr:M23 family metallopeptidase [Chloroflexota bacterium]